MTRTICRPISCGRRRPTEEGQTPFCLFHVVNITLNVVKATRLAWQQRKAESFTVSPLHCGAAYKGYRPSKEYAGGAPTAFRSAPPWRFPAPRRARTWATTPRRRSRCCWRCSMCGSAGGSAIPAKKARAPTRKEGPRTAIRPLAEETFGLTTDTKPWVYLSDGGHFENLGLYEMVRRRCRFIVAIDAGCDPDFALRGSRQCRAQDLHRSRRSRSASKELDTIEESPDEERHERTPRESERAPIPYHAIGTIHYRRRRRRGL